jgi:hypothetical protein
MKRRKKKREEEERESEERREEEEKRKKKRRKKKRKKKKREKRREIRFTLSVWVRFCSQESHSTGVHKVDCVVWILAQRCVSSSCANQPEWSCRQRKITLSLPAPAPALHFFTHVSPVLIAEF